MRYHVPEACDYDGTLAHDGRVHETSTGRLGAAIGLPRRQLVLVTRSRKFLEEPAGHSFQRLQLVRSRGGRERRGFSVSTRDQKRDRAGQGSASRVRRHFAEARRRAVVGRPCRGCYLAAARNWPCCRTIVDQGLELQVVFNKDAVMVLPSGVNKATGLAAALAELNFSAHEAVGIGDAENDHAFLSLCECAVAFANALPAVQNGADLVTRGDHGSGVEEVIGQLIDNDLAGLEDRLNRHRLLFGHGTDGAEVRLEPYGYNLLIAGPSGSGKSTAATSFLERLTEHHYQYCISRSEGDYENLAGAVTLGNGSRHRTDRGRSLASAGQRPARARWSTWSGLAITDRPPFSDVVAALLGPRARTGHPHWLVVDEAHHLLPASWAPGPGVLPKDLNRTVFITVHPDQVARAALETVAKVVAVGQSPGETVEKFYAAARRAGGGG